MQCSHTKSAVVTFHENQIYIRKVESCREKERKKAAKEQNMLSSSHRQSKYESKRRMNMIKKNEKSFLMSFGYLNWDDTPQHAAHLMRADVCVIFLFIWMSNSQWNFAQNPLEGRIKYNMMMDACGRTNSKPAHLEYAMKRMRRKRHYPFKTSRYSAMAWLLHHTARTRFLFFFVVRCFNLSSPHRYNHFY